MIIVRFAIGIRGDAVKTNLARWIRSSAILTAILLLLAATFVLSITVALPLVLVCVAAFLVILRYWDTIKTFDLWTLDKWVRVRIGSIGIHDWYTPYHAANHFCDPTVVRARNDAAAKMNSIMMELVKERSIQTEVPADTDRTKNPEQERARSIRSGATVSYSDYEAARAGHTQHNLALACNLLEQLIAGGLIAKGSLVQNGIRQSERIIPTSRWNNMDFDISKSEASGHELHYVGIAIGKKSRLINSSDL